MNTRYKNGFTLIETLVAITILMIAIAGPLTVATKAYAASLDARNRTIATSLAQETMEYLNNIKDNSSTKNTGTGFDNAFVASCFGIEKRCDMSPGDLTLSDPLLSPVACIEGGTCRLYTNEGYSPIYSHTSVGGNSVLTSFTRYFYMTALNNDTLQSLATVVVSWKSGSGDEQVLLQEVMTNVSK